MTRRILSLFVIVAALFITLGASSASAQTTVQVVLTVPILHYSAWDQAVCNYVSEETINGTVFPNGNQGQVSPNGTGCSNFDGGIGILMPPQPYYSNYNGWITINPDRAHVVRGALAQVTCPAGETAPCYQSVDSFSFSNSVEGNWNGTLTRQWQTVRDCDQRCGDIQIEVSDVVSMTGTVQ